MPAARCLRVSGASSPILHLIPAALLLLLCLVIAAIDLRCAPSEAPGVQLLLLAAAAAASGPGGSPGHRPPGAG